MGIVKEANTREYEAARSLWTEVFGDSPELIDAMYAALAAQCYVLAGPEGTEANRTALEGAGPEGELLASLVVFDAGKLQGRSVKMIYAVATRPELRGQGYGSELVRVVKEKILAEGGIPALSPAEASLEQFYSRLGFRPCSYAEEIHLDEEAVLASQFSESDYEGDSDLVKQEGIAANKISPEEYMQYRERFLATRERFLDSAEHIQLNANIINLLDTTEELLCVGKGDAIAVVSELDKGDAIAVVSEPDGAHLQILELLVNPELLALSSELAEEIAIGLARLKGATTVSYRTCGGSKLQLMSGDESIEGDYYYGFPLD